MEGFQKPEEEKKDYFIHSEHGNAQEAQKAAREAEIRQRNELVQKLSSEEGIKSLDLFKLKEMMFRASDLSQEEKEKVWDKIDNRKKE